MTPVEKHRNDIPEYLRGRLEPARAEELASAARQDPALREAIEQERKLDRLLEAWDTPEPADGFEVRFWKRFHESRGALGRTGWLIRLAGPVAAAALVAVGLFLFFAPPSVEGPGQTAVLEPDEIVEFHEHRYLADPESAVELMPNGDDLALLKLLDDPAFAELDAVRTPDDLALLADHALLQRLLEFED